MDDILELPNADVSRLQERGQSEGAGDGDSSADEEEGGLDWTKLPYVFCLPSCRYRLNFVFDFQSRAFHLSTGYPKARR